jgi:hypothetical protein
VRAGGGGLGTAVASRYSFLDHHTGNAVFLAEVDEGPTVIAASLSGHLTQPTPEQWTQRRLGAQRTMTSVCQPWCRVVVAGGQAARLVQPTGGQAGRSGHACLWPPAPRFTTRSSRLPIR